MNAGIEFENRSQSELVETLREKAERFDRFARSVPAVLYDYVIDSGGVPRCLYCSHFSVVLFGIAPEAVERDMRVLFDLIHPDDRARFHGEDRRANRDGTKFLIELRVILPSGQEKWLRISSSRNPDKGAGPDIWSGYMIDISDTKHVETLLNERATHDYLTGLVNRQSFQERLEAELGRVRRYGQSTALLLMDVDHFKTVNDRFGHDAGDHVLKALSTQVRAQVRAVDTVARWGGEEFTVLLPETGRDEACDVAERIRRAVEQQEFDYRDNSFRVTVSIGVARLEAKKDRVEPAMRRADEALYQAKRSGRNRVICD